jgi:hypothetical protein
VNLRDEMLFRVATLQRNVNYSLDDSIVDLFDRKRQGEYERDRSATFEATQTPAATGAQGTMPAPPSPLPVAGSQDGTSDVPYASGPHLLFNAEPLLVNVVGSRALRPMARTQVDNMFLAADYVQTETDLACMEGANEAARLAVNALLDAAASPEKRCETWTFSIPEQVLERLRGLGRMDRLLATTASVRPVLGGIASGFADMAGRFVAEFRRK